MKNYPPQKKKKKSFGSLPLPQSGFATTIMVFFAHLFLLIYSSQKVPTSLKFYRALHILVLHMRTENLMLILSIVFEIRKNNRHN